MKQFSILSNNKKLKDISEVEQFEKITGISLPLSFKEFLLNYEGCSVRECYYYKEVTLFEIEAFLPLKASFAPGGSSVEVIMNGQEYYGINGMIPFAIDPNDNVFNISVRPESYGEIWLNKYSRSSDEPLELVSKSFGEFINGLSANPNMPNSTLPAFEPDLEEGKIDKNGIIIINERKEERRIQVGINETYFKLLEKRPDGAMIFDYLQGQYVGVKWRYGKNDVLISSDNIISHVYPSHNLKYMIVVYNNYSTYKTPYNAIVYNEDGSIHKILTPPPFRSKLILDRLKIDNVKNPPLHIREDGVYFDGISWGHNSKKQLVTLIDIGYDREYIETRVLYPKTGEFGELLSARRL
jgi:hypothetical protein